MQLKVDSGKLPVGWEVKKLGEVCQIKPPKEEARQKLSDTDIVSFVPMSDLGIQSKTIKLNENKLLSEVVGSYTYFADNDVLLAKITPCFENGKLGIARNLTNAVGFGSSEYIVFRSKGTIEPEYLFYFLSQDSFRNSGAHVMTGAVGHKRVPKDFIENHPILLPSLPEQKRIVAILDEAFEGIDRAIANTKKNLANSRELFESYLNAIFTQKGDRWGNIKSQFVPLSTLLSEQPRNGWSPPAIFQTGEGIPVLTLSAVTGFNYDGSRVKLTSAPTKEKAHYWLKEGELLITRSNTPELVGHVAIYDGNPQQAICCDLIMKMTLDSTKADTRFIYYYLRSLAARKYLMSNATGASATMPKINKQVVQNAPIPVFCVAEQKIIVTKLDEIASETQRLETIYRQKIAALNELKQSILQKAFTGELTADTANQTTKAANEGIAA